MREPCVSKATGERTGIRVSAVQKRKVVKAIQQQTNNRIDKVTNDAPQCQSSPELVQVTGRTSTTSESDFQQGVDHLRAMSGERVVRRCG